MGTLSLCWQHWAALNSSAYAAAGNTNISQGRAAKQCTWRYANTLMVSTHVWPFQKSRPVRTLHRPHTYGSFTVQEKCNLLCKRGQHTCPRSDRSDALVIRTSCKLTTHPATSLRTMRLKTPRVMLAAITRVPLQSLVSAITYGFESAIKPV